MLIDAVARARQKAVMKEHYQKQQDQKTKQRKRRERAAATQRREQAEAGWGRSIQTPPIERLRFVLVLEFVFVVGPRTACVAAARSMPSQKRKQVTAMAAVIECVRRRAALVSNWARMRPLAWTHQGGLHPASNRRPSVSVSARVCACDAWR